MTLLYGFYGDDFTGSTDVLEQLAEGGVDAVLYLRAPDAALRARFPDVSAIGIAGDARSRSPAWMDAHLPGIFASLGEAPVVHYKTCSTFDSAPKVGSIGRALDIGTKTFGTPAGIVVAAPHLRRYVIFGNLFAAAGREVFRIDRHPTMARHPVTPMHEADLIRHLADQSNANIALIPLDRVQAGEAATAFREVDGASAVLFDGVTFDDLAATGEVLVTEEVRFLVGSSGVTRALVLAWRARDLCDGAPSVERASPQERLLVVSGSCSPVTSRQIGKARMNGYATLLVEAEDLVRGSDTVEDALVDRTVEALNDVGKVVIHSAEGPLDPAAPAAGERLGEAMGRITRQVIDRTRLARVLFAGGDTSSYGVAQLGIEALTWAAPIERGAPLVRAHSDNPASDGLELVLKGGQMGGDDFFESVRLGNAAADVGVAAE